MSNEVSSGMWKDWRLHFLVLGIVVATEAIGSFQFSIGPGVIILLPFVFALIISLILYFTPVVKEEQSKKAESIMVLGIGLLLAKIGVTIGPSLPEIIAAGPALLLQELGNLGAIFIALPIAILLGMKRESIGMTHSVSREPNVGLIMDKYGLSSPEGRGVIAIYIFGTVFGAVFMGLTAGLLASLTPLSPLSLAMATGMGSSGMMAGGSGSLIEAFPDMESQIIAYSGASNLLTLATGLYMSIFIALPLTEKLYQVLTKNRNNTREKKQRHKRIS